MGPSAIKFENYYNQKIPLTIGLKKSINNDNSVYVFQFKFDNKYLTFKIIELGDKKVIRDCHLDILINKNIRKINNKTLHINRGVLIKYENQYKLSKLKTLNRSPFKSTLFMTLDIETLNIDNKLIPYAIGFYNGKEFEYEYGDNAIINIFKKLFIKKYHNYVIYVHNLSKFDYIYLIDQLSKMNHKVEIIPSSSSINIVKFIIKYEIEGKIYKISFHDSIQILNSSLDKLCKSFDVPTKKSIFPYNFMDSLNKINYIGIKPDKYLYTNGLPDNYDNIKFWDAKKETLEYLKNDCVSLYQIIDKFSHNIHLLNGVDISKYPTLPSIAMAIFRTKYYDEKMNITNLKGKVRTFIQKGYFGGIVDVYIPQGVNLYCYDINSLYPFTMLNDMPIGDPTYVLGDIDLDKFFGFLKVKIKAPDLNIPFLPKHHNGFLISPIGEWEGVYFSEELKYAKSLGYQIEILEGIQFNKGKPFDNYVNEFYKIKSLSDSIRKMIAKLLLNSLYGRMGMNEKLYKSSILDDKQLLDLLNQKYEVELAIDRNNKVFGRPKKE